MREEEKVIVCNWTYSGNYAIYNLPSYEEMKQKGWAFANPNREKNFLVYYDRNVLTGFTNILEKEDEVFIGIGVSPELCGKGYGQKILKIAKEISNELYPGKPMCLEVRSWNKRAISCYEKAGFVIEGNEFEQKTTIGVGKFYKMICE